MLRPISKRRARHAREQVIPSTREHEHLVFLPHTREWAILAGEHAATTAATMQRAGYVVI